MANAQEPAPQEKPGEQAAAADFTEAVDLLHRAGNSCYALANGLLGDKERATRGGEVLQEYFDQQESAVSICQKACSDASAKRETTQPADPAELDILNRYGKAVANLCAAATESADSVQSYGKRVSKASFELALTESNIERKTGRLLGAKKVETAEVPAEGELAATEEASTDSGEEMVAEEVVETAKPTPPPPKVDPPPPKVDGDGPAPYWDEKRKQDQIQESQRVQENRRIQEDRDRIRREKREKQELERQQAAAKALRNWYAIYADGTRGIRIATGEVRAVLEGQKTGRLVDLCRSLEDEAKILIGNKKVFTSPVAEVDSLLASAARDYRRLATDCLQGRTQKLGLAMRDADGKMVRIKALLKPYRLEG